MVTANIRTHEVRVGDLVTMPDGTHGEVDQILDRRHLVVFKLNGDVESTYHILRDDEVVAVVLEA